MKIERIFVWLLFLHLTVNVSSKAIERATMDLLLSLGQQKLIHIDFMIFTENSDPDVDFMFARLWKEIKISVRSFSRYPVDGLMINFAVKIFNNGKNFIDYSKIVNWDLFDRRGFYFILFTQSKEVNSSLILDTMWKKSFYNVNILIMQDDRSVELVTFFPFGDHYCREARATSINRYINNTWERRDFFPMKFKNFHNCPIKISAAEAVTAFYSVEYENGTVEHLGSEVEMLKVLAATLNFSRENHYSSNLNDWGRILENGTSTGIIEQVRSGVTDLMMGHSLDVQKAFLLDYGVRHFSYSFVVIVPPGGPYTSIENLLRPFSLSVWITVMSIFICAIFMIYLLRVESSASSFYNLFIIFIGGTIKISSRQSSRILIMTLIVYCFIMRTAYQSKMFHYLQAGDNKSRVKSLDEMRQRGFDIYLAKSTSTFLANILEYPSEYET